MYVNRLIGHIIENMGPGTPHFHLGDFFSLRLHCSGVSLNLIFYLLLGAASLSAWDGRDCFLNLRFPTTVHSSTIFSSSEEGKDDFYF